MQPHACNVTNTTCMYKNYMHVVFVMLIVCFRVAYQHPTDVYFLHVGICEYYCCLFLCLCVCICQQRREEEYERFQRDKMVQAKNEFKALLKETKKIDYM